LKRETKVKPVCKNECRWLFWRNENPNHSNNDKGFGKYAKKLMNKARRRFYKKELREEMKNE